MARSLGGIPFRTLRYFIYAFETLYLYKVVYMPATIVTPNGLSLTAIYDELRVIAATFLSDSGGYANIQAYFNERAQQESYIKQDLLPLLVFVAISERPQTTPSPTKDINQEKQYVKALPLTLAWALYLAASHMFDEAQDSKAMQKINDAIMALGMAHTVLAKVDTDVDTLRDILEAFGQVAALSANAQNAQLQQHQIWSKADYLRNIGGRSAAIIAVGIWSGGRLITDDEKTLSLLKNFGLALGTLIQISDDCMDLAEDLANGIFTLPVLEGLSNTKHSEHTLLKQLITQPPLGENDIQTVIGILQKMGAIDTCKRIIRAYQVQVSAVFNLLPGLSFYFANYVSSKS